MNCIAFNWLRGGLRRARSDRDRIGEAREISFSSIARRVLPIAGCKALLRDLLHGRSPTPPGPGVVVLTPDSIDCHSGGELKLAPRNDERTVRMDPGILDPGA